MTTKIRKPGFNKLKVGSLESRKKDEMTRLIENLGGIPLVVPSMKEVPVEGNKKVFEFGKKLMAAEIDVLILFTGVGTRALIKVLSTKHSLKDIKTAFQKTILIARGPKSLRALSEYEIKPTHTIPEPNTWREILKVIDEKLDLTKKRVAVQEYGESNKIFLNEIQARGAMVTPVPVYKYEFPEDTQPLLDFIHRIINGELDVVVVTNATQIVNLMSLAQEKGLAQKLRLALNHVVVGSVGPTCSETLRSYGWPIDVEPSRPMMGALVASTAERSQSLSKKKNTASLSIQDNRKKSLGSADPLINSLLLKACRKEPVPRTPVWLMRQAGRYMKEYRELRAKVSFLELCKSSDLASEVTVDAAHRLGVDAAIIFSDILIILEPMGFKLDYIKNEGPEIGNPFRKKEDLKRLQTFDVLDKLRFTFDAIRKTRHSLKPDIPLIGFVGAPFTLASYLIEGQSSRNFLHTKGLMYDDSETWHTLLDFLTEALIGYLNEQIRAGAQVVQIFDSWVGALTPEDYRSYVLPHVTKLVKGITPGIPVINFGTQTGSLLPLIKRAGGDVVGVDWRVELDEAWNTLGDVAIMGNLDPVVLLSNPKEIRSRTQRILNQAKGRNGHIFNLGHGVLPKTPIENVLALVESVKELSQKK